MSKSLVQILYNPSSISSTRMPPDPAAQIKSPSLQSTGLMDLVLHLEKNTNAKEVHLGLIDIKRELSSLCLMEDRLSLLQNFNRLTMTLSSQFTHHADIFQTCIQIITLFKENIDSKPQHQGEVIQREWVELEKSIYHLSSWENQLDYFWSETH